MDKDYILNNVEDFTAEQLFDFIRHGIVTLDELRKTEKLDASKRIVITKLQANLLNIDNAAWNEAKEKNTVSSYTSYTSQFPNGINFSEAKQAIQRVEETNKRKESEAHMILEKLTKNPNAFPIFKIKELLKEGAVTKNQLLSIGIPNEIIERLNNVNSQQFLLGENPDYIPDGYTEVYFWGIRGSGKTTALSAVLSTANRMGFLEIAQGPGYNYMLQLQNNFDSKISTLPAGTNVDVTQYLPFTLKKSNEKYYRSISLIELSGEIFQCFLYKNASIPLPTLQHENTFNTLLQFLQGPNPKIHFFFVDYEKENNVDQQGYTQANYLNAAATFFNNPEYNFFGKNTDAIYVVVTKSDLMPTGNTQSRVQQISEYLNENNFIGFINSLRAKCKKHSINNGRVLGTPFSLGKVYFNEICDFDNEASLNLIDILMRRIAPKKTSILDIFNK